MRVLECAKRSQLDGKVARANPAMQQRAALRLTRALTRRRALSKRTQRAPGTPEKSGRQEDARRASGQDSRWIRSGSTSGDYSLSHWTVGLDCPTVASGWSAEPRIRFRRPQICSCPHVFFFSRFAFLPSWVETLTSFRNDQESKTLWSHAAGTLRACPRGSHQK